MHTFTYLFVIILLKMFDDLTFASLEFTLAHTAEAYAFTFTHSNIIK